MTAVEPEVLVTALGREYALLKLDSCSSTNDVLRQMLRPATVGEPFERLPLFVQAAEQTAGRGRLGRQWRSLQGGLYLSLLWPGLLSAEQAVSLPLITALAARAAVQPLTADEVRIKWPNDLLLLEGRGAAGRRDSPSCPETISPVVKGKLAGILVELVGGHALIGIGINVVPTTTSAASLQFVADTADAAAAVGDNKISASESDCSEGLPSACLYPAACCGQALIDQLRQSLATHLLNSLEQASAAAWSFSGFAGEYRRHLAQLGEWVEIRDGLGSEIAAGTLRGIDVQGRLVVCTEQGEQLVYGGELTQRKPPRERGHAGRR
ncbi:MAG: biotin--[acetyl-CoA-carboxylase] ligase [Actinomycetia bacterium]|nr:biotin--[acetyl-CoA-carboxylase] ligase [Actinomycetes bacterium]